MFSVVEFIFNRCLPRSRQPHWQAALLFQAPSFFVSQKIMSRVEGLGLGLMRTQQEPYKLDQFGNFWAVDLFCKSTNSATWLPRGFLSTQTSSGKFLHDSAAHGHQPAQSAHPCVSRTNDPGCVDSVWLFSLRQPFMAFARQACPRANQSQA